MSYSNSIGVAATVDLSSLQWRAVAIGGTLAATAPVAIGILGNKPEIGDDAQVIYSGRSKFAAGAAVTAGAELTTTASGWFITATSGDRVVGLANITVVSGAVGADGLFNFATKGYKTA